MGDLIKDGRRKPYRAEVTSDHVTRCKYFSDEMEAVMWVDQMYIQLHAEYARTNKMMGLV